MLPVQDVASIKQLLLPPTPLESWAERLVETLPRRLLPSELVPLKDIAVLDPSKGEFRATGDDPWFELVIDSMPAAGGWLYLEAAVVRNTGSRVSSLHIELDAGGDDIMAWQIATNFRGSVREVVLLPAKVRRLMWQPSAAAGFFSQSGIIVHHIGSLESVLRRVHRVVLARAQFAHDLVRHAPLHWRSMLSRLQESYSYATALRARRARGMDYETFLALRSRALHGEIARLRKGSAMADGGAILSLVTVLERPDVGLLRTLLDSVTLQIHGNWEHFLIVKSVDGPEASALLNEFENRDARFKMTLVDGGGNDIVGLLNHVLRIAKGSHVVRLGQHGVLAVHALARLAKVVQQHPAVDLVYSDMDFIDHAGVRSAPVFKPDWNPDLFMSQDYIGSLAAVRRGAALESGGYLSGFEGAEDYELNLRMLRQLRQPDVRHVAEVLYSDRLARDWTTSTQRADCAGLRAVRANLPAGATDAVMLEVPGLYRIRYQLPDPPPLVSIIVPTRDRLDILRPCIDSIRTKTTYPNWEIVIVDNRSEEPRTREYLRDIQCDTRIRVLQFDRPFNYSAINNFAAAESRGDILALVNNDVEVIGSDWLTEMVCHAVRPGIGAVGAKLLYANGTVQHAGVIMGIGGVAGHAHKFLDGTSPGYCGRAMVTQNMSAVTGACLVVRKSVYEAVGGLNETDLVVALNDVDFCLKLLDAGLRNVFTPFAVLYHHESISRGRNDSKLKQQVFMKEFNYVAQNWRRYIANDPCYNPNLTLQFEDFSLKHI
jgi:O-antigen biosynthesis protein